MARIARVVVPNIPHHIIQRGNRRQQVFFKKSDYKEYKTLMREWCREKGVEIWAYCLMSNHVHLIAVPEEYESLAQGIGEAHRRYTRMINFSKGWRGYLWEGRFKSYPLDNKYLHAAVRYIEMNPVRAGMVKQAWDYEWSSAQAHIMWDEDELITLPEVLKVGNWKKYLEASISEEEQEALRKHSQTGRPLGSESFISKLEKQLKRVLRKQKPGPKVKIKKRSKK